MLPRPRHRATLAAAATAAVLAALAAPAARADEACTLSGKPATHQRLDELKTAKTLDGHVVCKQSDGRTYKEEKWAKGVRTWFRDYDFGSGKPRTEESLDAEGRTHGLSKQYDYEGRMEYETTWAHGKRQGPARAFHPNGKLRELEVNEQDKVVARIRFTQGGKLDAVECGERLAHETFKPYCGFDGKPVTVTLHDYKDKPRGTVTMLKGKETGATELDEKGRVATQRATEGEVNVRVEKWPNGKTKAEVRRTGGFTLHGVQREFDQNGRKLREATYEQGFLIKDRQFFQNGSLKLSVDAKPKSNERFDWLRKTFYDDGTLAREEQLAFKKLYHSGGWRWAELNDGITKSYDEDGTLRAAESWKEGERHGKSTSYFDDGETVASEQVYEEGRLTRSKIYDESAKLISHEEYFADGSKKILVGGKTKEKKKKEKKKKKQASDDDD